MTLFACVNILYKTHQPQKHKVVFGTPCIFFPIWFCRIRRAWRWLPVITLIRTVQMCTTIFTEQMTRLH